MDDNKAQLDRAPEIVAALRCRDFQTGCTDCHYYNGITCVPEKLDADAAALIEAQAAEIAQFRTKLAVALEDNMASEAEREQWIEREKALWRRLVAVIEARDARIADLEAQHRTEYCEAAGYDCAALGELRAQLAAVTAERDAAVACIEKIDAMFGNAYPNEILEVLDAWRGPQGAGEGENHE